MQKSDKELLAVEIADKVEPDFKGKGKCCTSWSAKKWKAAYEGAMLALSHGD